MKDIITGLLFMFAGTGIALGILSYHFDRMGLSVILLLSSLAVLYVSYGRMEKRS